MATILSEDIFFMKLSTGEQYILTSAEEKPLEEEKNARVNK